METNDPVALSANAGTSPDGDVYEAWFRATVETALAEADEPNAEWISNDAAIEQSRQLRALWQKASATGA